MAVVTRRDRWSSEEVWGGDVGGCTSEEKIGWFGHPGRGSVGRDSWSLTTSQTNESMEEKYGGGVEQVR